MRAALLTEYHRPLDLIERPVPEPAGPRDVVVRIGGAGVCATDLHAIDGLMEPAGLRPPVVLGHENAGWVHTVGDGSLIPRTLSVNPSLTIMALGTRLADHLHADRAGYLA